MSDIESQTTFLTTVEDDEETVTTAADESVATKGTRGKPTRVRDLPEEEADARVRLNAKKALNLMEDVAGIENTDPSFTHHYDDANVVIATEYFRKTFTPEKLAEKLAILTVAYVCEKFMTSASSTKAEESPTVFMKKSCAKLVSAKPASSDTPKEPRVVKTRKSGGKSAKPDVAVIE